jgi:hypothetical protein
LKNQSFILRKNQESGNTLLELVLGMGIVLALSMSVIEMNNKAQAQEKGRLTADTLQAFTQVAAQYFIANRSALESAMSGLGAVSQANGLCAINITALTPLGVPSANVLKHTCAIDTSLLRAKGLWPQSWSIDQGTHRLVAVFRMLGLPGDASPADEVLILTTELEGGSIRTQGEVLFTASLPEFVQQTSASLGSLGASGGYVPPGHDYGTCHYNTLLKEICGQGWRINMADFL